MRNLSLGLVAISILFSALAPAKDLDLHLGDECRKCSVCFPGEKPGECLDKMKVVTDLENVPFKWKCSKIPNQTMGTYVYGLNEVGLDKQKELCSYSESQLFFFRFQREGEKLRSTLHAKESQDQCIGIRAKKVGLEACNGSPEQHLVSVHGRIPSERID